MMLGRAAEVIPVEFVVRGYLAGSGWVEYQKHQTRLRRDAAGGTGRVRSAAASRSSRRPRRPTWVTTRTSTSTARATIAGRDVMERLRDVDARASTARRPSTREARGIILADTKFEFGYALDAHGGGPTRSSSSTRCSRPTAPASGRRTSTQPGREQDSFDKQYVRNYLLELVEAGTWDKTPARPRAAGGDREEHARSLRRSAQRRSIERKIPSPPGRGRFALLRGRAR